MRDLTAAERLEVLRLLEIARKAFVFDRIRAGIDEHGVVRFPCNNGEFVITIQAAEDD